MSVEIKEDFDGIFLVNISGQIDIFLHDDRKNISFMTDNDFSSDISKLELARLITALQAMHDKMIDNNED